MSVLSVGQRQRRLFFVEGRVAKQLLPFRETAVGGPAQSGHVDTVLALIAVETRLLAVPPRKRFVLHTGLIGKHSPIDILFLVHGVAAATVVTVLFQPCFRRFPDDL